MKTNSRKPSSRLTFDDAVALWPRIENGEFLNRIAADYDVNPGRIAEIKKGYRFQGSREVSLRKRPH
jgi:hypothetical protein